MCLGQQPEVISWQGPSRGFDHFVALYIQHYFHFSALLVLFFGRRVASRLSQQMGFLNCLPLAIFLFLLAVSDCCCYSSCYCFGCCGFLKINFFSLQLPHLQWGNTKTSCAPVERQSPLIFLLLTTSLYSCPFSFFRFAFSFVLTTLIILFCASMERPFVRILQEEQQY